MSRIGIVLGFGGVYLSLVGVAISEMQTFAGGMICSICGVILILQKDKI